MTIMYPTILSIASAPVRRSLHPSRNLRLIHGGRPEISLLIVHALTLVVRIGFVAFIQ